MNNPSPSPTTLQTALERYKNALNCLSHNSSPNKNQVLEILSARDALGKLLETENSISSSILSELIDQDSQLKEQAYKITQVPDLPDYQGSLPTTSQAWLLDIEAEKKSHPWNSFEWWLKGTKILIWTINLALFSTLATRFLSSGSGFLEVALIAFPGVLSLLQLQKELTKGERKRFYKLLKGFNGFPNISGFRKVVAIFISSLVSAIISSYGLFLGLFLLIWFNQPFFSERYKNMGKTHQTNQNLVVAEQKYLKSIALDSDNFDAYYKLATLYEELQDIDKAKKEYLIAAKGGHLDSYNNLAYWYIRQDKDAEAINLLNQGLKFVAEREKNLEKLTDEEKLDLKLFQYNLFKNIGWARFEQKQDEYAKFFLLGAIDIVEQAKTLTYLGKSQVQYIDNPGAAYCLYAQLLEQAEAKSLATQPSQQTSQAKRYWQECRELIEKRLASGEEINPEEDSWLYEAKIK